MPDIPDFAEPKFKATGPLYTMDDAARLKGVSYHTVSRAVRRGLLPAQRLGKMVFISVTDLQAWKPMVERAPRKFRTRQHATEVAPTPLSLASSERADLAMRLSALLHISEVAISDQPLPVILAHACEKLTAALNLRRAAIWQIDDASGVARRVAAVGKPIGTDAAMIALSEETQLTGFLRRDDSAIVAQRDKMERRLPNMLRSLPSVLIVPLRVGAVQRGWIFADRDGDAFDLKPDDLGFAQAIGNQVALILERR